MPYITPEMLAFLAGIRANNTKEWFTPRKPQYLAEVYEPLKALGAVLYAPYADKPEMMHKVARIYRDANFPPYLHYRDTMWIYVRREADYWSRTPSLYFEVSPEGASFGLRMPSPAPAFMAQFRQALTEDASAFTEIIAALEQAGLALTGEEYKRPKPCPSEALLPYFKRKSLAVETKLPAGEALFSEALPDRILEVFAQVWPLHEYLWQLMAAPAEVNSAPAEPLLIKPPHPDFMW